MSIAEMLRRSGKKVIVAVNKVDNTKLYFDSNEFYRLGFDEVFPISSTNGSGTGDLLDAIVDYFKKINTTAIEEYDENIPKVAFVGRPNAGKSTLINTLLGEERNIVTDIPGTTRDTIDALYNKFGHKFVLVDTAGIRKKRKIFDDLEFYSVVRSVRAIERSDVAVLIIDVTAGITSQDMTIFNIIKKNHKGVIIVMNKWDLVDKDHKTMEEYKKELLNKIAPFTDVPVLFISAKNKKRIFKVIEEIEKVYENTKIKIPTHKLNEVMLPLIEATPPPMYKGKKVKIKYVTQLPSRSVSFAFFCNHPQYIKEPYKRFLENKLRENFELTGVPVNIILREK
jgi:GTP-binding protein